MLTPISAKELSAKLNQGAATLIDIREPDEYARAHIAGAHSLPLSRFTRSPVPLEGEKIAVFCCKTGQRTSFNTSLIKLHCGATEVYALEGGVDSWEKAGLELETDRKKPIEIIRQVQITIGSLILVSLLLGLVFSPWFLALSAVAGVGMLMAGITGSCALASLIAGMPWNKSA